MQAVADALGVDRTSLHYYVGDRDGLLELVVADLFESELGRIRLRDDADWGEVLRAYANAVHRGVIQVGATATHFRLSGTHSLAVAELVLESLGNAGFTIEEAGQVLALVSGIAYTAAHDALGGERSRRHQTPKVARALREVPEGSFPLLGEVVGNRAIGGAVINDFDFGLDVVMIGLERRLKLKRGQP